MYRTTLIVAGLLLAASCTKYEEGPTISLVPRADRIANTWIIASASEDGQDISGQYDQYEIYFTDDGDAELTADYSLGGIQYSLVTEGTWSLVNDDEELVVDYQDDSQDERYQILRLTQDELWLREVGGDVELKLTEK